MSPVWVLLLFHFWVVVVVVVVVFTLTDRASTIPSNIRGCQSGTWSQRGTKVNGSHHGDNPLLRPTGIQIATKSYATLQAMAPTNNKTVHQTSFTLYYREQPRSTRIVFAYPRPAFSATNRTNTFQPVLIPIAMLLVSVYLILFFPLIVVSFSPSVFFISLLLLHPLPLPLPLSSCLDCIPPLIGLPSLRFYAVASSLFLLPMCFLFVFSILSRRCPLLATFLSVLFCLPSLLISHLNVLTFFPPDWGLLRRSRCVLIFL